MLTDVIRSRIREINDGLLKRPRLTAAGHIVLAALIAASIASLTALTSQIPWLKGNQLLWYATSATLPIIMASGISVIWHLYGAPWLHRNTFRGWILHSFYKPNENEVGFTLPAPETYLVIASAASAGAVITLAKQPWIIQLITATTVGAITAAAIAIANPNTGQPLARGKLNFQTETQYKRLLLEKASTQRSVLKRQRNKCSDCHVEIQTANNKSNHRFAIKNEERIPLGRLNADHIKMVCSNCARTQPTTHEVNKA